MYFWYNEKKVLKNTDLKPLKIADVSKKMLKFRDFWWFSL